MNPEARAIIRWVPASRGGRRQPPCPGTGYCAPVRFESDPEATRGWWSLRLTHASELRGPEVLETKVAFLFPDAPHDMLKEGERFELMEGKTIVAKGIVLPSALRVPEQLSEFELALLG